MVYIIAVNPGVSSPLCEGSTRSPLPPGTSLPGGRLTLPMGLTTNYPFALAAGLGLNAVVAFSLPLG